MSRLPRLPLALIALGLALLGCSPISAQVFSRLRTSTAGAAPDTTDPVTAITAPSSGATYDATPATSVTLSGTCTDAGSGCAASTYISDLGANGNCGSGTTWSCGTVSLRDPGDTVFTVTTVDVAGNDATDVITVTTSSGGGGGSGAGCTGSCLAETSFLTAEGWSLPRLQTGSGCSGPGFWGVIALINGGGGSPVSTGECEAISTAFNYSGGAGGGGVAHYRGNGSTDSGPGYSLSLPSTQTKLWISMRKRYSSGAGFTPAGVPQYMKDEYWHDSSGRYLICGYQAGSMYGCNIYGTVNVSTGISWSAHYGANTSDGRWDCLDYEFDIPNTRLRIWINGTQVYNSTSQNYSTFANFTGYLASNQNNVSGGTFHMDVDDIKIDNDLTTNTRIGCVGSGG